MKTIKISDENYEWLLSKAQSPNKALDVLRNPPQPPEDKIEGLKKQIRQIGADLMGLTEKFEENFQRLIRLNGLKFY